ncbi:unnamed protein product [Mesocestoides corti]|uniref:Uncharacterized protein n=1 Tax=Mesocestoides corti TaxID=53468 RepID=A0A0R3UDB3_MESCO|nr:unnamed protein product [Mesocestoides corti]
MHRRRGIHRASPTRRLRCARVTSTGGPHRANSSNHRRRLDRQYFSRRIIRPQEDPPNAVC